MTKKILIGALVVVLVGALAVAALDLWSGSASAEGGQQHGRSTQQAGSASGAEWNEAGSRGRGRQEQESAVSSLAGEAGSQGRGRQEQDVVVSGTAGEASRGQGNGSDAAGRQGQESGQANPEPEASVEEWLTYEGSVVALDDEGVTIATGDGQELAIKLGPPWYRETLDFSAEVGDRVSVIGFYEGDEFEAGQVANQTNGQTLILRDEDGRPLWAGGRGRQGQR